ncbi:MAG: hypothetical protein RMJ87_11670 [Cytophagales bacterium]|nr:hypothetical protein [Bernardetiaceae bacterium]MDW8205679.1 hypothetical protein [Cytophagales bacterium]
MAKPVRKISDKDFNKLIERAYFLTHQEQMHADKGEYDLEMLKKAATEMGIPPEKLEQAYEELQAEQAANEAAIARKALRQKQVIAGVVIALIVLAAIGWLLRPRTFEGTAKISIATSVDNDNYMPWHTTDTITTAKPAFFAHAFIKGDYGSRVEWELFPPNGEPVLPVDEVVYAENRQGTVAYQLFRLSPQMPLGEWKIVLKIFEKPVATHRFVFAKAKVQMQVAMTKQVDSNYKPLQNLTEFQALTDTVAICHLTFLNITAEQRFRVVWEFYDPDGNLAHTDYINLTPKGSPHYAYCPMTIDYRSIKTGKWTVKVLIDGEVAHQRTFDISVGNADIALTTAMENDKPVNRVSIFKSQSEVYGYVFWSKINQQRIVLTWKLKDDKGNLIRSIDQPLSNRGGTDWWAYRRLLDANEAVPGNYNMELWGGNLLIGKRSFQIVK